MLILVEGIDGSGKTTLVDKLAAQRPDARVIKKSQPTHDRAADEYMHELDDYRAGGGHDVFADRWHWGEPVYGPLYRGRSLLGPSGFRCVEHFLRHRGALMVWCHPDLETVRERLRVRGEDFLQERHIDEVYCAFERVAWDSMLPTFRYPTEDADHGVAAILECAEYVEWGAARRVRRGML